MENDEKQLKTQEQGQDASFSSQIDQIGQVRTWLESQPLTNPVVAAENVFEYLRDIQDKSFNTEDQFEILELFEPVLKYLWHSLRNLYLGTTSTPYREKGHIIFLCHGLEMTAANVYAMLVSMLTKSAIFTHHKSLHALLTYRIMYHLIHVLIGHYQLSCKPPENIWHKFHKLYLHAERYQLLDVEIDGGLIAPGSKTNLETTYKHALLLSTCDPFKLRYAEIEKVHQALFSWASLVLLSSELEKPLFKVDLTRDFPPHYADTITAESDKSIGLDTYILAEHMEDILEQRADIELTVRILEILSKALLEHLKKVWHYSYVRRFPRRDTQGEMMVCIGIRAAYAMLGETGLFETISSSPEKEKTKEATNANVAQIEKETPKRHFIYEWQISNAAPEGFCLMTIGTEKEIVQPGEMVILKNRSTESDLPWQLGVLRWTMREESQDKLKVGVETLSINARAVLTNKHASSQVAFKSIIYPSIEQANLILLVIVPPNVAQPGDIIHVANETLEYDLILSEPLIQTDNLHLYPTTISRIIREDPTLLRVKGKHDDPSSQTDAFWEEL